MRAAAVTEQELRASFETLIAGPPADNGGMPSDTGIDARTQAAIERVWAAAPNPPPALIEAARNELAQQLDGTHAQEADARAQGMFQQRLEDRGGS